MFRLLARLAYTFLVLIEALIGIRFVLLLINANRSNDFVSVVMKYSEYFVSPFYGVTKEAIVLGEISIDLTSLVALVFYMVLAFVAIELVKAFSHD